MKDVRKQTGSGAKTLKIFIGLMVAATVVFFAGFLFVIARRLGWTPGWIYVGMVAATLAINLVCLKLWNPELIRRRTGFGKFTMDWDIIWAVLFGLAMITMFVVAGKEMRGGVPRPPGAAWLLGFIIFVPGWALAIWSMVVNPFFEKTVRIQTNHGHRVIDQGPYAWIRHPGYVGFSGWILSTPLLLGSSQAFIPALIAVGLLVVRTALEDRTLRAELPGYAEYATRVRSRLVPGIW
jgi:protein-S-isoprenylcysteine O-methyltransferase Ste14